MNPWRNRNTTLWSSECEGATEYWKDHTELRHKLTIRRKESRKLVNHGTQTFEIPSGSKPAAEVWVPDGVPPRTKTQQASDGPHQMPPMPLCYLRG
ncbi:hypothetical protein JTB14_024674 [Gonioctena quinquepunctata]|nr:hypothetical protein JTB14_024674 [Gonioctena quinquepunctata]